MKIIALEEHFLLPEIEAAWRDLPPVRRDAVPDLGDLAKPLLELGRSRLDAMDEAGIDVQVLSLTSPGVQVFEPEAAIAFARAGNAAAAAMIAAHPDRFQAFASLPTTASAADNVAEFRHCIVDLGFKGALLNGRTLDRNLDHPDFLPIFETAVEHGVPVYVHPQLPQRAVRDAYYSGFGNALDELFAGAGFGWHAETGVQAVRLILSGLFDRLPDLQVILGHWGELALHFSQRLGIMTPATGLKHSVPDYFRRNFYVTPSGMFQPGFLERSIELIGIDRIMFSADYPFVPMKPGAAQRFLEEAALSADDKHKIASGNWEALTGAFR